MRALCVSRREDESINYTDLSSRLYFRRGWLLGVRREIRFQDSAKTLRDTLYGWSMDVGSAQAGLPGRVTSARLLRGAVERERNRLGKRKKVIVGVWQSVSESGVGPSIPALLDHVTSWGEGELHSRTFGRPKGMKITKRRRLVSFFPVRHR